MLNIASANMPKIKPEIKVLIIKTLKSKSKRCLNGRCRAFASTTKSLATFMTDPGRADRARQLLEITACWSDCQKPGPCQPPHSSRRSGRQRRLFHQELYIGFLLTMIHGHIAAQKPALNKREPKKPCWVRQGLQPDGRLDSRKVKNC